MVLKHQVKKSLPPLFPRQIYEELDKYVVGQDNAKKAVAIAAYNHIKRVNAVTAGENTLLRKSNILLAGPTGCGKTHIARHIARILDVKMTVADATEYTEAGYYGKDVEVMVGELLFACELDVAECERGVIFIDEIDKLARRNGGMRTGAGSRDIGGEGVQQALLKIIEGRKIFVPLDVTQHWSKHDFTQVDTSNILFICAGTFSDVWDYRDQGGIGFNAKKEKTVRRLTVKKLTEYGMIMELLGRIPVVVELDALNAEALFRILKDPPDSVVKEYVELLSRDNVELAFEDEALWEIAEYAHKKKLGARALRGIIEEIMSDVLFDAPERGGGKVKVDKGFAAARLVKMEEERPLAAD